MNKQRILWTACSVSPPPTVYDDLKRAGCEVLMADGDHRSPVDAIGRISPKVWVTDTDQAKGNIVELLKRTKARYPAISVVVLSTNPSVEEAVEIIRAGAAEYMSAQIDPERLLAAIEKSLQEIPSRTNCLKATALAGFEEENVVACDPAMKAILDFASKAATRDATVLLQGESGSGKEVVARFIHRNSPRKDGPFVAINCAALPENLLESELFGHEKGAFTGASARKQGKFELADGGTLLLDEISEMAPSIQAKLLRAIQERQIDRVGGRYPVQIDVRIIATTNKDLEKEVRSGNFRLDLYYRLNVVPLKIPPLRSRKADIIPLAELFLSRQGVRYGTEPKRLDDGAKSLLQSYSWPGNVRELENFMERVSIFVDSSVVSKADIENLLNPGPVAGQEMPGETDSITLKEMEKRMIMKALKSHNGNRTHAARVLGISVRTLRNKLKEYKNELGL